VGENLVKNNNRPANSRRGKKKGNRCKVLLVRKRGAEGGQVTNGTESEAQREKKKGGKNPWQDLEGEKAKERGIDCSRLQVPLMPMTTWGTEKKKRRQNHGVPELESKE